MKANPVFSLYIPTKLVFGCGEIKKFSRFIKLSPKMKTRAKQVQIKPLIYS